MSLVRSWLGVLCAVFLLAPSASAQTAPTAAVAGGPDSATLQSIAAQVAQIRGLQPLAEPDVNVLDHVGLRDYLASQFDRDYLPAEREADQKVLVALGLIKPTDDVVQLQLGLLNDQVIGIYDADARSLLVVGDQGAFGPSQKMTYAHEFDHALQDQHYDLNRLAPKHHDSNDRSLAVHAVIEGDAIMLQTLWAAQNLSQDELAQLARASSSGDDALTRVPLIMRTELLFPYVEGFSFVRSVYRQGGSTYAAVDQLFSNPPVSTAQLLHYDKYRDAVLPVDVQLPDIAAALGPGWRHVGDGVLGELDTRVLLEQWGTDHGEAVSVASGWAGDRWQLVEKDGRAALVLKTTWESPSAAQTFFSAYARGLRQRFGNATTEESSVARQALTTPVNATDLRVTGTDVTAVLGFDRDTANALVSLLP